jgi:hypothetical protein
MYESRKHPPLPWSRFVRRLIAHFLAAMTLLGVSLFVGMYGYQHLEQLSWRDAFLNSAMLLGGMGPVNTPTTDAGKIFAGVYALYAGLFFLITVGIMFTPVLHRVMHTFHWDDEP